MQRPNIIFIMADDMGYGDVGCYNADSRIPLLARWPDGIQPDTVSDQLFCLTDLLGTCAGITGFSLPQDAAEDSFDMGSVFLGSETEKKQPAGQLRESVIHHSSFGVFSIRQGNWKLVADCPDSGGWPTPRGTPPKPGHPGQLYDILADPGEEHNFWDERPDIVGQLLASLQTIRDTERTAPERNL